MAAAQRARGEQGGVGDNFALERLPEDLPTDISERLVSLSTEYTSSVRLGALEAGSLGNMEDSLHKMVTEAGSALAQLRACNRERLRDIVQPWSDGNHVLAGF